MSEGNNNSINSGVRDRVIGLLKRLESDECLIDDRNEKNIRYCRFVMYLGDIVTEVLCNGIWGYVRQLAVSISTLPVKPGGIEVYNEEEWFLIEEFLYMIKRIMKYRC